MSKTLYRTYRPHNFSDVLGQDVIVKTLQNAIKQNHIGHAYLFTGPRGTGKTTVARLFAIALNTQKRKGFEPVSKEVVQHLIDGTCMDIIEIDAASNTGVDDIRTLKENIGITPLEAKYKVYIIDEVHMLSTNAFNALLKTLEEPPKHVIFILATTEIHKIPATILSRCQRFDFARFTIEDIIKKLVFITDSEKIKIEPDALELIAIAADGGMRDAESLLAQVIAFEDKNITASIVTQILGTVSSTEAIELILAFAQKDISKALSTINDVIKNGYNMESFIRIIIEKLRVLLFLSINTQDNTKLQDIISIPQTEIDTLSQISKQTSQTEVVIMIEECVRALQKTKNTTIVQLPLEVASVNICGTQIKKQPDSVNKPNTSTKSHTVASKNNSSSKKIKESKIPAPKKTKHSSDILIKWKASITKIEKENKSISSLLTQCEVQNTDNNIITICTTLPFYQEKIIQAQNRSMIEGILTQEFGTPIKIEVIVTKAEDDSKSELLSYAKQLMGGIVTE